jgi:glyoxylase-like metal-dependent hydrolase (beta-lactamase superfamily II)
MAQDAPLRSKLHVELGTRERPVLIRWCTWREGKRGGYDSYMLITSDGPVLLDPQHPTKEVGEELLQLVGQKPIAVILTNDMHERTAYRVREQTETRIWAPLSGQSDLERKPDVLYEDGAELPGGLRALNIEGRFSGDTVLRWTAPTGERILFTGDTLCGAMCPDNPANAEHPRSRPGLYLGAGPFYLQIEKPDRLKETLQPLLAEDFDIICGAHGVPVYNAKPALEKLLDLDWEPLLAAKQHPYVPA